MKLLQELKEVTNTMPEAPSEETQLSKPKTLDERWKILEAVEKSLNKQFDTTTSIVRLDKKLGTPMPSISTGLPTLDYDVIGTGGIPKGRIVEFYGAESGGKTSLALHIIAQEQARGGICGYIDIEHSLDPQYMAQLGVDVSSLLVSQPDAGEQALETAGALVDSGAVSLIIIDSVSALVPQAELDGDFMQANIGLQARMMSQACRKLRGKCAINGVTIIFINQIRERIGVLFGSLETTSGGRALKFYASLRLDIRKIGGEAGQIKEGSEIVGHKVRLRAVKNKVGVPARVTEVGLKYGVGFDIESDFIEYAINLGVIEKSGGWLKYKGESFRRDDIFNSDNAETLSSIKRDVKDVNVR